MSQTAQESFFRKVAVPVTAGVILAALTGAIAPRQFVADGWDWLLNPVGVSRLWHGVLWLSLVALVGLGLLAAWSRFKGKDDPPHFGYVEDQFFGLRWKWSWSEDGSLGKPVAYCPGCGRMMRVKVYERWEKRIQRTDFECQGQECRRCVSVDGNWAEVLKKLAIEIHHKVDTGAWEGPPKA